MAVCCVACVAPAAGYAVYGVLCPLVVCFSRQVRQKREIKPYFESSYKVWQVWAPGLCLSVKPCS